MIACRGQSLGVFSGFGHGPDHKCAPRLAQETIMCMSPAIPPIPPPHTPRSRPFVPLHVPKRKKIHHLVHSAACGGV